MSGFVRRYAEEAAERVQDIENGLARLESAPRDKALVDQIMRQAHTVKGGARMLRLQRIEKIAHAMEDAMSEVGKGKRTVTPILVDALLASSRGMRTLLASLDPAAAEPERATDVDVAALAAFVREGKAPPGWTGPSGPAGGEPAPASAPPPEETAAEKKLVDTATTELESALQKVKAGHSVRVAVSRLNDLGNLTVEMTVERARARNHHRRLEAFGFAIARTRAATGGLVKDRDPLASAFHDLEGVHRRLVDESEDEQARRAALDEELRDHVQSLRLTPLRIVFDAFPASVREIARGLGKEVELVIQGAETELDRRIVDEVGEPLVHLVRNAMDHGIEAPADREKAGKPRRGRLGIKAWSAEGAIFVEVEDDGRGIDPEKLRRAAVAKGVHTQEEAARLSDAQAMELIFLPGFSTKENVSELSGRGVGMDSVRVGIGRLGGSVSIHSRSGGGTRVVCRLPLTLALLRVLLFRVGTEILAVELRAALWAGSFATAATFNYEEDEAGHPIPVVSMAEMLGFLDLEPRAELEPPSFLVLGSGGNRAIFVVDEVIEDAEVALKEAPRYLRGSRLVAGVTLLGTGDPAVVIEPSELLARATTRRALPIPEGEAP
jgi:two-component system chemotaxis sensor kinase CheA